MFTDGFEAKRIGNSDARSFRGKGLRPVFGCLIMWEIFGNRGIRLTWSWPVVVMGASDGLCAVCVSVALAMGGCKWGLQ